VTNILCNRNCTKTHTHAHTRTHTHTLHTAQHTHTHTHTHNTHTNTHTIQHCTLHIQRYLLTHWPERSVLILTADEIGNWGLGSDDKRFGPHGPGRPFKSNETSVHKHALLPVRVYPIFKQYFDWKQRDAFGSNMRFVPLGSRTEFPDVPLGSILTAPKRKFV
jgi:hypothetical protein